MSKKAVVAMSGGVDSSVSAALLVEAGYDVTGIMLKLWKGDDLNNNSGCCNLGAAEDARRVADVLGIPFYVLNFAERFEDTVVKDFRESYASGTTPNPCVRCNQWIKFDALLDRARALGADVLATGHYAQVNVRDGLFELRRGADANKDQSYVLWMLSQEELAHCRFPVGDLDKSETRRLAAELGLRTADKPDSQEICFVRNGDLGSYIADHVPEASQPGPIVDTAGEVVGEHLGIGRYTVGQRKGLGIALGEPVFVNAIDPAANALVVGSRTDLEVGAFTAVEASFVAGPPVDGSEVLIQHRAHGDAAPGLIRTNVSGFEVTYRDGAEALAPGQSAALYDATDPARLLGGGIISTTAPVLAGI